MLDILAKYYPAFSQGALVTIELALIAWIVGGAIGFAIGYLSSKVQWGASALFYFSSVIGSIPVIAILFWFHYPFQVMLGLVLDPFWMSAFVLVFINAFLVANAIHHAATHVPKEFLDCSRLYGLDQARTIREIELPMIIRASVPAILQGQVAILHMTLFASLISVPELFRTAQQVNAIENRVVDVYTLLALFYLLISLPIILLAHSLKRQFDFDLSER